MHQEAVDKGKYTSSQRLSREYGFHLVHLQKPVIMTLNLMKSKKKQNHCNSGKFTLFCNYSKEGTILFTRRGFMLLIPVCIQIPKEPSKRDGGREMVGANRSMETIFLPFKAFHNSSPYLKIQLEWDFT